MNETENEILFQKKIVRIFVMTLFSFPFITLASWVLAGLIDFISGFNYSEAMGGDLYWMCILAISVGMSIHVNNRLDREEERKEKE